MSKNQIIHIGQKRAEAAFQFVEKVNKHIAKEYASHVKRFPMIIKTNGLTYAVSFAYSKGKVGESGGDKSWETIYKQILSWLSDDTQDFLGDRLNKEDNPKKLMQVLTQLEYDELMWITTEVLELFNWLKRFAHGGEE